MTEQEFKKAITKASWVDKYYYYFISFAAITGGLFFLYKGFADLAKYQTTSSRILMFSAGLFLIALGSISSSLVLSRYKILAFDSRASTETKKRIISETMKEFGAFFIDNSKCFWRLNYQRRWWTSDYNIYFTFGSDSIFASVVSGTHGRGGFIDFGQTERFRKKLSNIIFEKLNQK